MTAMVRGEEIGIMIRMKRKIILVLVIKIAREDDTNNRDNDRDDDKVDELKGY